VAGIPQAVALNLKYFPAEDFLVKDNDAIRRHGARVVTIIDADYPAQLLKISDAPVALYVVGELTPESVCALAIVGARNASLYGLEMAERFACQLAELGCVVVSGLAKGIDAAAHRGALKAGGVTIGVLGCGIDIVYPPENETLYRKIREQGAIISEFPFGTPPAPFNFPRRNRIVSGLSLGVLVVEANVKSGALITADFASEQGREVFAVPGRIDSPLSLGPHALIKQGAKVVLSVEDILEELPVKLVRPAGTGEAPAAQKHSTEDLDTPERQVFDFIKEGVFTFEELERLSGLSPSSLMGPLVSLQIKRLIREKPGKVYEIREAL
jgi:DNA processing protein